MLSLFSIEGWQNSVHLLPPEINKARNDHRANQSEPWRGVAPRGGRSTRATGGGGAVTPAQGARNVTVL